MILAELGRELEKDKRAYNSSLIINYYNYEFYVTELIYNDEYKSLYFVCEDELTEKGVSPKDVVKEYKKKYKNDYECVVLNLEHGFMKNIHRIGLRCGDKNFGECDNKILY